MTVKFDSINKPNPNYTTARVIVYENLVLTLSKPLPSGLKVYYKVDESTFYRGNVGNKTESITKFLTIPAGQSTYIVPVVTKVTYKNDKAGEKKQVNTSFSLLEQPGQDIPDAEETDIVKIIQGKDFNKSALYTFGFTRKLPGNVRQECRVEILRREGSTSQVTGRKPRTINRKTVNDTGRDYITSGGAGTNSGFTTRELDIFNTQPITFVTTYSDTALFNEYSVINGTSGTLRLIGREELEFKSLFTLEDAELRLDYYEGNNLRFQLYNVSTLYNEMYAASPFDIECSWSCGLGLLKRIPFYYPVDTEVQTVNWRVSEMDIIQHCLDQLGSKLAIISSIQTYPVEATVQDGIDPLSVVDIDVRSFMEDGEYPSCARVIEKILMKYGARIYQAMYINSAVWVIEEVNAKARRDLKARLHAAGYVLPRSQPAKTYIPKPLNEGLWQFNNRSSARESKEIIKQVLIEKNLEYIPELFQDGTFPYAAWEDDGKALTNWTVNDVEIARGGEGSQSSVNDQSIYASSAVSFTLKIAGDRYSHVPETAENPTQAPTAYTEIKKYVESKGTEVQVENGNTFDIAFRYRISFGQIDNIFEVNNSVNAFVNGLFDEYLATCTLPIQIKIDDWYLDQNKQWVTTPTNYIVATKTVGMFSDVVIQNIPVKQDGVLSILIGAPAFSEKAKEPDLFDKFYDFISIDWFSKGGDGPSTERFVFFAEIDSVTGTYKPSGDFQNTSETISARVEMLAKTEPYEFTITHADVDTLRNVSAITYQDKLTTKWRCLYSKRAEALPVVELLAQKILNNYAVVGRWRLSNFQFFENGTGLGYHHVIAPLEDDMRDRDFVCVRLEYNPRAFGEKGTISGDWVEIGNDTPTIEFAKLTRKSSAGSSGGGGGSYSGFTENPFDPRSVIVEGQPEEGEEVEIQMKNGRYVVDKKKLLAEIPEAEVPDLDTVLGVGNSSYRTIKLYNGTVNAVYSNTGIEASSLFNINSPNSINFKISGQNALTISNTGQVTIHSLNSQPAVNILGLTTSNQVATVLPKNVIDVESPLLWRSDKKLGIDTSEFNIDTSKFITRLSLTNGILYGGSEYNYNLTRVNLGDVFRTKSDQRGYPTGFSYFSSSGVLRLNTIGDDYNPEIQLSDYFIKRGEAVGGDGNNYPTSLQFVSSSKELRLYRNGMSGYLKTTIDIPTGNTYTLPTASGSTKGGVTVVNGSGLRMSGDMVLIKYNSSFYINDNGELALNGGGGGDYVLQPATPTRLGGVKIGTGVSYATDGTISVYGSGGSDGNNYPTSMSFNSSTKYLTLNLNGRPSIGTYINISGGSGGDGNNYVSNAVFTDSTRQLRLERSGGMNSLFVTIPAGSSGGGDGNNYPTSMSFSKSTKYLTINRYGTTAIGTYIDIDGGGVSGSGTSGYVTMWSGSSSIANSGMTYNSSTGLKVPKNVYVADSIYLGATSSSSGFSISNFNNILYINATGGIRTLGGHNWLFGTEKTGTTQTYNTELEVTVNGQKYYLKARKL